MCEERNCRDEYPTDFPAHHLGGTTFVSECPTSLIKPEVWDVLDLFYYCHRRTPGFSGWSLTPVGLPLPGAILDQDHWTMWAFEMIEREFYALQGEVSQESNRGK